MYMIIFLVLAAVAFFLCIVFIRVLRSKKLTKPLAIRNAKRLILNSGLLAAAIYGLDASIPDPAYLDSKCLRIVIVYGGIIFQGAFWVISVVFAGVGVNALSEALMRDPETSDPEVDSLISRLPDQVRNWIL